MIAGLLMPTGGRIAIGGRDVTYLKPQDRNVGMVFQQNVLYSHMSVSDNLAYPLRVRGVSGHELKTRISEVAERLHISDVLQRMPSELSGGQSQRVAIGRMLVRQADVFLMDEPISHLDAKLRAYMRTELRHLQKKLHVTTLFVSHDQLEAMSMADRIVVMNDGLIQQFGTPQEVFDQPANKFVASFVGEPHMNILRGELGYEKGQAAIQWPGGHIALEHLPTAIVPGTTLEAGIRPEHVQLSTAISNGSNAARVEAIEPMGAESLVTVETGGHLIQVRMPSVRLDRLNIGVGALVQVEYPAEYVYLFDTTSGRTLVQASFVAPLRRAA
jgi:multiple sugar transport system ATP-binding protein